MRSSPWITTTLNGPEERRAFAPLRENYVADYFKDGGIASDFSGCYSLVARLHRPQLSSIAPRSAAGAPGCVSPSASPGSSCRRRQTPAFRVHSITPVSASASSAKLCFTTEKARNNNYIRHSGGVASRMLTLYRRTSFRLRAAARSACCRSAQFILPTHQAAALTTGRLFSAATAALARAGWPAGPPPSPPPACYAACDRRRFSLSIIRPIRRTAAAARRIGQGELQQRIEWRTRDDLGTIATELNRRRCGCATCVEFNMAANRWISSFPMPWFSRSSSR